MALGLDTAGAGIKAVVGTPVAPLVYCCTRECMESGCCEMLDREAYWSNQARQEFATIFDGGPDRPRLKARVAEALNQGWSGNRDKPLWALVILVGALSEGAPDEDGLTIISEPTNAIWHRLVDWSKRESSEAAPMAHLADQKVIIVFDGTTLTLSLARIEILKKIGEFLLVCNEFAFAREVLERLRTLAANRLGDVAIVREQARAFGRLAYKYRSQHFSDGHATSAFSILMQYLSERAQFQIDDDSVLEFWEWEKNDKYKTYSASFHAFTDFYDALADVALARGMAAPLSIDDPAIQERLSDNEGLDSDLLESGDNREQRSEPELDSESDFDMPIPPEKLVNMLAEAPMKLLSAKELSLIEQVLSLKDFGYAYVLASLRLIAFHPVQSGLSNSLRTGRSRLTLEERLGCTEAQSYSSISETALSLERRLVELLKIALMQRTIAEDATDARLDQVKAEGAILLRQLKPRRGQVKSFGPDDWRRREAGLLAAQQAAHRFNEKVEKKMATWANGAAAAFEADKKHFSCIFTQRYGS